MPKVAVTGNKLKDKMYHHVTGYVGNLKRSASKSSLQKAPERVIETAVRGMLPRNPLGRAMMKKLRIFAGPEHTPGTAARRWISENGTGHGTTDELRNRPPQDLHGAYSSTAATGHHRQRSSTGHVFRPRDRAHGCAPGAVVTDMSDKIDVNVTVTGGGTTGQAGAIRHGIARPCRVRREYAFAAAPCRVSDPRCSNGRAQESRSAQGAQASAVLEALTRSSQYRLSWPGFPAPGLSFLGRSSIGRATDSDSVGCRFDPPTAPAIFDRPRGGRVLQQHRSRGEPTGLPLP